MARQAHDYEAAVARHLAFIDRLLADKDELSANNERLAEQIKASLRKQSA